MEGQMMMFNLMFSNPTLQNTFSRATVGFEEIGGWLLCRSEPVTWPGKFQWRRVKKALGLDSNMLFIESFIIIPNSHKEKETHWTAWDFDKSRDMVDETAAAYHAYPVHFHTHPNGSSPATKQPSSADLAFAGAYLQIFPGCSEFAIVTHGPFRVWFYRSKWGNLAAPDQGGLTLGQFVSWREGRARKLL